MCTKRIQTALFLAMFLCFGIIQVHSQALDIVNSTGDTLLHVRNDGNVGIGITNPLSKLHVVSTGSPDLKIEETAANSSAQISLQNVAREWWVQADASPDLFSIEDRTAGNVIHFAIEGGTGNVGIGETAPAAKLVVRSTTGTNIIEAYNDGGGAATGLVFRVERATGDVFADGSFNSGGADVAEYVNTSETVEPGDVIEIDPDNPGQFRKAREAMSPRVAGIITTDPGVVLGGNSIRGKNGDDHPAVALAGRVPVKVMAKFGAIEIGDLLVSSPFPGYAMKCQERGECIGAIIGKAMEPFDEGVGKIMVQVMLR